MGTFQSARSRQTGQFPRFGLFESTDAGRHFAMDCLRFFAVRCASINANGELWLLAERLVCFQFRAKVNNAVLCGTPSTLHSLHRIFSRAVSF